MYRCSLFLSRLLINVYENDSECYRYRLKWILYFSNRNSTTVLLMLESHSLQPCLLLMCGNHAQIKPSICHGCVCVWNHSSCYEYFQYLCSLSFGVSVICQLTVSPVYCVPFLHKFVLEATKYLVQDSQAQTQVVTF